MNRSNSGLFDTITAVFAFLTVVVCLFAVLLLTGAIQPPLAFRRATPPMPTVFATWTITPSPTVTLTPLLTDTPAPTITPLPTQTETPTLTPSMTSTPTSTSTATTTGTNTPLPSRTPTASKTATATINPSLPTATPHGFPFRIQQGSPSFTANLNTAVGCQFQGVGGEVFDQNNNPLPGVTVNVSGAGFNQNAVSGPTQFNGPAGFVVQTATAPGIATMSVELRTSAGVPLSPKVTVAFPGSCNSNLALINFFQTRPY